MAGFGTRWNGTKQAGPKIDIASSQYSDKIMLQKNEGFYWKKGVGTDLLNIRFSESVCMLYESSYAANREK